jgi:uncharacterized protein (TIGR03437 family)
MYLPAGALTLAEIPYPGWVFYGWQINNTLITSALSSYTLTGPTTFTALFSIAKRVNFMTSPPGFSVLVDRTLSQTPLTPASNGATCNPTTSQLGPSAPAGYPALCIGSFDFLPGSTHTVGATTPQTDSTNNYWVFEGYTNGLGQNSNYVADSATNIAVTLTATFVPGVKVTLITSQPGLSLTVDGRSNWQGYNFVWGQGETHTISAPATQVDANGRTWTFVSWSNGGPATQTLVVPTTTNNLPLTATFVEQPQVTINSVPSGMQFTVDGTVCATPCVVSRATGYAMQVVAPSVVNSSSVSRVNFTSWSDGSTAATRTITFNQNTQAFTASYQSEWAVIATASPAGSINFTYSPATTDGFFVNGTQVTVTAVPATGYKFLKFTGDLTGTYPTGYLTMTGPHAFVAYAQSVPAVAPSGVVSAAGVTPGGNMAPGSIISIYGQNLAPSLQVGSTNPLPQTLANVTVTIGNYILPLLFVSPTQINAQLPVELVDGNYTININQTGQQTVTAPITVARDAPGVFTQANTQQLPLLLALHQDGTLVTFSSPALHGETISIYGTGFGPYTSTVVDGFLVPASPTNSLSDAVTLNVGALAKTPTFAGAAPGMVGMTLLQLQITNDMPTGTTVNLTATVNNVASATVVLPLQ